MADSLRVSQLGSASNKTTRRCFDGSIAGFNPRFASSAKLQQHSPERDANTVSAVVSAGVFGARRLKESPFEVSTGCLENINKVVFVRHIPDFGRLARSKHSSAVQGTPLSFIMLYPKFASYLLAVAGLASSGLVSYRSSLPSLRQVRVVHDADEFCVPSRRHWVSLGRPSSNLVKVTVT